MDVPWRQTLFYELIRGLGRDLAKLGDKLHQLEMAMGEFSLQQVRAASNVKSRLEFKLSVKSESSEMRNIGCLPLFSQHPLLI